MHTDFRWAKVQVLNKLKIFLNLIINYHKNKQSMKCFQIVVICELNKEV